MVNLRCFRRNLVLLLVIATCFVSVSVSSQVNAKPGASNTGPTSAESSLSVYDGPTTITVDGTVIEGVSMTKTLTIMASNVVVRNFTLDTGSFYGIQIKEGTGILIEDGIIQGMKSAAILGSNFTARRLEIRNSGADGIKPNNNFLIEDNWLHSLGYISDAHADGLQMVNGGNGVIRGNYFDMPHGAAGYKNSHCFIISTNVGKVDNILIEENWINGGGFSIQIRDKGVGFGDPTNVRIINNRFGTDYQFGIFRLDGDVTTAGNVWEATSKLVDDQTSGDPSEVETPVEEPSSRTLTPSIVSTSIKALSPITISVSSQSVDAKIYYTLDGSRPTEDSRVYTQPLILMQSAVLQAVAKSDGMELSTIAAEEFLFAPFGSSDYWGNLLFPERAGSLGASVEFIPVNEEVDSVIGFSSGQVEDYSDLAVIVRFAPTGLIDARDGSSYKAVNELSYQQGQTYTIDIDVNIASQTYSATVTDFSGNSVLIASNYKFRTEQAALSSLDTFAFVSVGSTSTIKSVIFDSTPGVPTGFARSSSQ